MAKPKTIIIGAAGVDWKIRPQVNAPTPRAVNATSTSDLRKSITIMCHTLSIVETGAIALPWMEDRQVSASPVAELCVFDRNQINTSSQINISVSGTCMTPRETAIGGRSWLRVNRRRGSPASVARPRFGTVLGQFVVRVTLVTAPPVAVRPPSIVKCIPDTLAAALEHRNSTTPAISSGNV
jgi:hypothetical protein